MPVLLRNLLAVAAGLVIGSAINMAIVVVGPMVLPPPEGVDLSDMDQFAENLKRLRPIDFVAPWLAHALGTFVGAVVAATIAIKHKMSFAIGIGVFFMLGSISMVVMYGGPIWFAILDLVGAYIPMGYFAGRLAIANKTKSGEESGR